MVRMNIWQKSMRMRKCMVMTSTLRYHTETEPVTSIVRYFIRCFLTLMSIPRTLKMELIWKIFLVIE